MLAVSRGIGIGSDENAGSFSTAAAGIDAALWSKIGSRTVMNSDNGKPAKDAENLESGSLAARKRPREEETHSPALFFKSNGTTPTGLPVSPTISTSTAVASSPAGSTNKIQGGFGAQIGNFQPIQPHGPLFKEADGGSHDPDSLLPKTPEGWGGAYGRGEGDPITESPLILAPEHAEGSALKQVGVWDHPGLQHDPEGFAVPSPPLVPSATGGTPEESRRDSGGGGSGKEGRGKEEAAPFELCCITPTHSLFASADKSRASRRSRHHSSPVTRTAFLASPAPAPAAAEAAAAANHGGARGEVKKGAGGPGSAAAAKSGAAGGGLGTVAAGAGLGQGAGGAVGPGDKGRKKGTGLVGAAKPKPIRPEAGAGGGGGEEKKGAGGGHFAFPSDPASPFTIIPSPSRAEGAGVHGSPLGKGASPTRVSGLMGHPPASHPQWLGAGQDRQHRPHPPYYHPQGGGMMGVGEVGEGRGPMGKERERRSARYKGVTWDRVKRMWRVRLCLQGGARQHVGYYQDEEEGAIAYVTALSHAKAQGLSLKQDGPSN